MTRLATGSAVMGFARPPPRFYELADRLSELLLLVLIVFCPWAFGTNPPWAMKIANTIAYAAGLFLGIKRLVCWRTGYVPPRWGAVEDAAADRQTCAKSTNRANSAVHLNSLTLAIAAVTIGLLAQCVISGWNARATYSYDLGTFTYHDCFRWLPYTYDSASTWRAFWNYLAWSAAFWSLRDWLLGIPQPELAGALQSPPVRRPPIPSRLRRLLWVLSLNGAVLAFEATIQQASGTNKLLFFHETYYNRSAELQFGPFPYRSNGAQYVNLIWPMTLGFWLSVRRAGSALGRYHLLLACTGMMIAAPAMTLSRGAVLITAAMVFVAGVLVVISGLHGASALSRWTIPLLLVAALAGGVYPVEDKLAVRMKQLSDAFSEREKMTAVGRKMLADALPFGTGAETLQPVYQLYKGGTDEYWPGQLHNDWLETRVTFGAVGFAMILCGLVLSLIRWFLGRGIAMRWCFISFLWLAVTGCLVHARWDLPFQVYSITLLFLLICAILLCLGKDGREMQ